MHRRADFEARREAVEHDSADLALEDAHERGVLDQLGFRAVDRR